MPGAIDICSRVVGCRSYVFDEVFMSGKVIVTGAAGFIGSCLIAHLNRHFPQLDILAVDEFRRPEKASNYRHARVRRFIPRQQFYTDLPDAEGVVGVFHLGARTDTLERDWQLLTQLNIHPSKVLWNWCARHSIPLVYASSAATYGDGRWGFVDRHDLVDLFRPLNAYGKSKNEFDKWALRQNVFGPNEYHKGRMASVVWHGFHQIRREGVMRLFKSYRADYADGEQRRDFIYIKDAIAILIHLWQRRPKSGLYNAGTGKAQTFNALGKALFEAMDLPQRIEYIDMPVEMRSRYQYYTCAEMTKLEQTGFDVSRMTGLGEAVREYVREYLLRERYYS